MSEYAQDSIAAIATAPGAASVGIIRISGPAARSIQPDLLGTQLKPQEFRYLAVRDERGEALDHAVALYFAAPRSLTGEDVLEIQGHGGPVVLQLILRRVLSLGVRPARAGEFTERAFLNHKLDLAQAEAVADLISAGTENAARAASRSLSGAFSLRVQEVLEALTRLRVFVESAIDFPTEEIDFLAESDIGAQLEELRGQLEGLLRCASQGVVLRDGLTLAIVGAPNAGKSSLLNALTEKERAIVTDIPGTTRDVLTETVSLDGIPLHLVDTAGLRDSDDRVEQEGIRRAKQALGEADHVLLMIDLSSDAPPPSLPAEAPAHTLIYNKVDVAPAPADAAGLVVSARTGEGIDTLKAHLKSLAGAAPGSEGQYTARTRHVDALHNVQAHLAQAAAQADHGAELLAEELRLAQNALASITGEFVSNDLLGEIFSSFCIGK
ncbi:MAG: tRNA uridine-5-carboxymethylaminomethyl(34) synthesis GTPase MnmE [Pseudomonadota bacterium]